MDVCTPLSSKLFRCIFVVNFSILLLSVLWCWFGVKRTSDLYNTGCWCVGGVDLSLVLCMSSVTLVVSCCSKSRNSLTFWYWSYPRCRGNSPSNECCCVYLCFSVLLLPLLSGFVFILIISSLLLYSRFLTSFLCVSIPLCPQLPIWVQRSHHHLLTHVAFEFFFSLLLVYLWFCLQ